MRFGKSVKFVTAHKKPVGSNRCLINIIIGWRITQKISVPNRIFCDN